MSREQVLTLGMATALIIALVMAAFGFYFTGIDWASRVVAQGLELYYGKVQALEAALVKSKAQEARGADNYETLGQMYDRLTDKYLEAQRTINEQAERLKQLERYHNEQGRT
jgi:hypothetical protein